MVENRVARVAFNGFLWLARVSMAAEIPGRASPAAWLARRQVRAVFWWLDGDETANYNDRLWRLRERIERGEKNLYDGEGKTMWSNGPKEIEQCSVYNL